jgi:hypothetical protein
MVVFCQSNRLFSDLVITPTQYREDDKDCIRDMVLAGGGQYSQELVKDKTTHLIIEEAKGKKYEASKVA